LASQAFPQPLIAFDSEDCNTPQRLAACVKEPSSQIARKYWIVFKFIAAILSRVKAFPIDS
jgi:hypothetical protein